MKPTDGLNFRERARRKRLVERWSKRFADRSPEERALIRMALDIPPLSAVPTQDPTVCWMASFSYRERLAQNLYGYLPGEDFEALQARIFKGLLEDLMLATDVFTYEAVYFGVGIHAFPEAVDPGWQDGQY